MYIKQVVLDAFKSYANRTVIPDFDREFNAITGLNGTGKSNILDAICFVLGISNLTQIRAGNLQDLIYMRGQGKAQTASVSITFDNTDKSASPVGYEDVDSITITRQVVLDGKSRYLVQGLFMSNTQVHDLFRSVNLNVNNPTFLIMQGKIAKMLDAKPAEILGMIEEAAGTKMYEHKKLAALNTIDKKEVKLQEIEHLLRDNINPTLERLEKDRRNYAEYEDIQKSVASHRQAYLMHVYHETLEAFQKTEATRENVKKKIEALQSSISSEEGEIVRLDKLICEIETKQLLVPRNELNSLMGAMSGLSKSLEVARSDLKMGHDSIKELDKKLRTFEKNLESEKTSLNAQLKSHENRDRTWEALKAERDADQEALQRATLKVENASKGIIAGDETSLRTQLDDAKAKCIELKGMLEQFNITMPPLKAALQRKLEESRRTKNEYERSAVSKQGLEAEIRQIEAELKRYNFDASEGSKEQDEVQNLGRELQEIKDSLKTFDERNPRLAFGYRDPFPGFDRSKVFGIVAKLFTVKDPMFRTAIEVAAGGRLYNVVVDTESTSRAILENKCVQRRVTFIPLDKIHSSMIDDRTLRTARALIGTDRVWRALELIECEPRFERAMRWIFGGQLICMSTDAAEKLANHPQVARRCVTIDGDSFDPRGIMVGGKCARDKAEEVLEETEKYIKLENKAKRLMEELQMRNRSMISPNTASKCRKLKEKLDMKRYEFSALEQRLAFSDHQKLLKEIEELKSKQAELEEKKQTNTTEVDVWNKKVKELKNKLQNLDKLRDIAMDEAKKELVECERRAKSSANKAAALEKDAQDHEAYVDAVNKEISDLDKQIQDIKTEIQNRQAQLPEKEKRFQEASDVVDQQNQEMKKVKEKIATADAALNTAKADRKGTWDNSNALKLNLQKLEHDFQKIEETASHAEGKIKRLEKDSPSLPADYERVRSDPNSTELTSRTAEKIRLELVEYEEKEAALSKIVNVNAIGTLSQTMDKVAACKKKKKTIEQNKKQIREFIDELDQQKNKLLRDAHETVDKSFNEIFSILIPKARAKLVKIEKEGVLKGLEVKVALGNKWLDSLDELSGGQRSLTFLSLILAILLFRPAPLYILDEVDSALDLSHTQNIGTMLKQHFKQSQFIVASLKDGMFSNANVLFRTEVSNGVSSVKRETSATLKK